ncbi:hypothetical protein CEP54_008470 [Fusarium duplospermum]|uniref:Uncharacterized protein n=1 Tax=Fusarium duplospermum TaxID=1325734 RepID=A0A428PVM1_9HYPO|nr:hypothetical protein CEP54_008470 [Fusarium duplospermum]
MTEAGTSPLLPLPFIPLPELAETLRRPRELAEAGTRTARLDSPARCYFYFLDNGLGISLDQVNLDNHPFSRFQWTRTVFRSTPLSSPYRLSWASLRFAIGRLFSLDNHDLTRGWFSFVTDDTRSQLQPR